MTGNFVRYCKTSSYRAACMVAGKRRSRDAVALPTWKAKIVPNSLFAFPPSLAVIVRGVSRDAEALKTLQLASIFAFLVKHGLMLRIHGYIRIGFGQGLPHAEGAWMHRIDVSDCLISNLISQTDSTGSLTC